MADSVTITEVGLRDGLQNHPVTLSTDEKLVLLEALLDAGISALEVTSFVSSRAVPQLADAPELAARLPKSPGVAFEALVPNMTGFRRACDAGFRKLSVVVGATDTFNRRNIGMGLDATMASARDVLATARADGIATRAYISMATACPYEGPTPASIVHELAKVLFGAGACEVIVGDSIGAGTPRQIESLFARLVHVHGAERLCGHFHDTQGMGLANTWAALGCGIRRFDAAIGGLGGCPFAPGASGNLATEDIVHMLEGCGVSTGIDEARLGDAVATAERLLGAGLGGRVTAWRRSATHGSITPRQETVQA